MLLINVYTYIIIHNIDIYITPLHMLVLLNTVDDVVHMCVYMYMCCVNMYCIRLCWVCVVLRCVVWKVRKRIALLIWRSIFKKYRKREKRKITRHHFSTAQAVTVTVRRYSFCVKRACVRPCLGLHYIHIQSVHNVLV